ncbi:response regulator receiver modulated metal dependent phosphohydrolase [Pirellula staleyi DSM 6068]|uniref:Response regulator receiver modulated metal dependent phosphohydrolase n=1 Tax=Pirellula staleyi (strain ATCC 27377 / DSM 6068 / ICPB 4128) TaxID=530564 RepID=D2R6C5_PIRSD|nr:HD domain-containing phosphohydrolase [Pirellula staleyi]ADB15503.1 response regulator receiver modulated metal dependent phosphohydrolase [Pirellula staleyi DSM 6068]
MKILIADDDDLALEMLEHTLRRAGYEVETARNGREALARLKQVDAPRLVISDWEMPEMTGIELCAAIRSGGFDSYIYAILLTSHARPEEIVQGMSAGADDFVAKPFNTAELLVRIRAGARILSLETREMAIFALAKLAESRDPETGHHLERVQCYSRVLAQRLAEQACYHDEVDSELIHLIYLTSPLHDIGKVGIPDCVLRKPGRLNDDEFAIMKTHATLGAATLDAALIKFPDARFLTVARDIAASHHERWDGRGYPSGLKGKEIPLCGRIVALADVYDALTSRRCYKEAFTHTVAKSIIVGDSGSHFDPAVVEAFLAAEQDFLEIQKRFSVEAAEAAEKDILVGV